MAELTLRSIPFICLEQKTSKSIGLRDRDLWKGVASALPNYLDEDGLAAYFPGSRGSDILTSYVLAVTDEAKFDLPDGARDAHLRQVEGIERIDVILFRSSQGLLSPY